MVASIVRSKCFIVLARDDGSEDKSDDVDLAPVGGADRISPTEMRGFETIGAA
jgi:hypothetical protein